MEPVHGAHFSQSNKTIPIINSIDWGYLNALSILTSNPLDHDLI